MSAGYDEGIIEIVADRLAPLTTVVLVDPAGSVLLPLENLTYYLGLEARWDGSALVIPAEGASVRIDTATSTMSTRNGPVQIAQAELVPGPILYLRVERIAELLNAELTVDFATLTVTITRETPFPAQQRVIAEQRRALLLARQRQLDGSAYLDSIPYAPISGVGIADWEISTNGLDPSRLTSVRSDVGIAILGGDLNAGGAFEFGSDAADRFRDGTIRYHRVFPRGRYLTQVRVGDVLTNGLFARYLRGVELSNRPFLRGSELSSIIVQPDLPAGWEYEVFQGNQLLGYSDVGSIDPVSVPLRAGTTPVQVRMYGPGGEEVISTLLYQTPASLLHRDAVEYSVGAGRCAAGCEQFAHADLRYGASSLFTVGGGFELLSDSAGESFRPYFVYSMASGTRATAELTYMPFALYSANVSLFPRDGSSAHVRGSISRPGFGPVSLVRDTDMRWDSEVLWDERLERQSFFSQVRIGASAAGMLGGLERWRLSTTGSFSRGFIEARYDHDDISINRHLVSARAAAFMPFTIATHTLRPLLNSSLGFGGNGFQLAEIGLSIQPRSSAVISAGVQWSRGSRRPTFSLGYSAHIGSVQSALRAVSSASGVASSSLMVSGSTSFAPDGSVSFQPSARSGYAGIHGTVYVDNDADGSFSTGDETVPGMHLIIGGHRAVSDDTGEFRVWGLQPYDAVVVAIDSTRTPDPSWTTSHRTIVIRPAPNMARRQDVQLVRTRELIGTLTAAPGVATVAGLSLDIHNLDTGDVTRTVTFSDGLFYVSRVRPGRYRIDVAPASLDALNAAPPAPIEFVIPASGDEPVVELPPIRLEPRPR